MVKWNVRAFAGVAIHPDLASQQLGQPFGNGQAQSGAAVMARGGGIDLLERLEEAALLVQRECRSRCRAPKNGAATLGMAQEIGVLSWPVEIAPAVRGGLTSMTTSPCG